MLAQMRHSALPRRSPASVANRHTCLANRGWEDANPRNFLISSFWHANRALWHTVDDQRFRWSHLGNPFHGRECNRTRLVLKASSLSKTVTPKTDDL